MTKKEYRARQEAWRRALADGRVVRFNDGMTMKSFSTGEKAKAFVAELQSQGVDAGIVTAL